MLSIKMVWRSFRSRLRPVKNTHGTNGPTKSWPLSCSTLWPQIIWYLFLPISTCCSTRVITTQRISKDSTAAKDSQDSYSSLLSGLLLSYSFRSVKYLVRLSCSSPYSVELALQLECLTDNIDSMKWTLALISKSLRASVCNRRSHNCSSRPCLLPSLTFWSSMRSLNAIE